MITNMDEFEQQLKFALWVGLSGTLMDSTRRVVVGSSRPRPNVGACRRGRALVISRQPAPYSYRRWVSR